MFIVLNFLYVILFNYINYPSSLSSDAKHLAKNVTKHEKGEIDSFILPNWHSYNISFTKMVSSSPAIISCFYEIYYFYLQRFIYKPVGYIPQRQNESEYKKRKCDFSFFNISIGHKLSLSLQNLIINPFNYMAFTNNIMIVRHRLLTELVKLWKNGELTTDKIDRLPLELSPRRSKHAGRCCVHKERAVWKYKSLPLLGLDMDDETDELTPLSEYAARSIERANNGKPKDNIMCVIDEACSACVQINYEITDLCRGCTARSCQYNCPKGAVHVHADTGKAWIDHDTCISCGICHKSCPYHAIVYIPVPCEESCPVKAISKDEHGIEHIDENKCIYCGKCMNCLVLSGSNF